MNERKKDYLSESEKHVLGMVKDEDGSYYPGCILCQKPAIVIKSGKIEFGKRRIDSPEVKL